MTDRTNAEWQELIAKLRALTNDTTQPREKRREAQLILDKITRPTASAYHPDGQNKKRDHDRATVPPRKYNDDYDGRIV